MNAADIFDVVTGKSKKPVLTKSSSETEDDARKRYGVDYSVWKRADNKAQKYIVTSVDEQPLLYIMNCETAKEMWDKLLSVYEQKSATIISLLQEKFYSYVMDPVDMDPRENKMFSMVLKTGSLQQADQANIAVKNLTLLQWHEILSHQNVRNIVRTCSKLLETYADSIYRNKKQVFLRSVRLWQTTPRAVHTE